ncbi:MAG: hypothetical protein M3Z46_03910 [Actinomycetota bacterium]|nr:hypothetical protein [Actinomycetota bacterium]
MWISTDGLRSGVARFRLAYAGAAIGGLLLAVMPMTSAAAAGPRFYATSACETVNPYAVHVFLDGFPPNDTFIARIALYQDGKFQFAVDESETTDENGAGAPGLFQLSKPSRLGILFFHDRDHSNTYSTGDDVITDQILTLDQPCSGGVAQPK